VKLIILGVNVFREDQMSGNKVFGDRCGAAPTDQCADFTLDQSVDGSIGRDGSRPGDRQPVTFREFMQAFESQSLPDQAACFGRQSDDNADGWHCQ
jgi:hypothetical protein